MQFCSLISASMLICLPLPLDFTKYICSNNQHMMSHILWMLPLATHCHIHLSLLPIYSFCYPSQNWLLTNFQPQSVCFYITVNTYKNLKSTALHCITCVACMSCSQCLSLMAWFCSSPTALREVTMFFTVESSPVNASQARISLSSVRMSCHFSKILQYSYTYIRSNDTYG